jgi:predicted deacylase
MAVEPGKVGHGYLEVGEFPNGERIKVPIIVIHGSRVGPRFWIEACIHGDEYDGTIALLNLSTKIRAQDLSGTLVLVPVLNIPGFFVFKRANPFDDIDMNRVFPGSSDGTFAEQYAHDVLQEVTRSADYLIDIHSGGLDFKVCYWSIFEAAGGEVEEKSKRVAEAMLAPAPSKPPKILWREEKEDPLLKNALFAAASKRGVPSIIFEGLGGGQSEYVETGAQDKSVLTIEEGLLNVFKTLNMIDGHAMALESQYVTIKGLVIYPCNKGGIFRPLVKLGDKISKNQTIATLTSLLGDVRDVKSSLDGIVLGIRVYPVVAPGMWIFELGKL